MYIKDAIYRSVSPNPNLYPISAGAVLTATGAMAGDDGSGAYGIVPQTVATPAATGLLSVAIAGTIDLEDPANADVSFSDAVMAALHEINFVPAQETASVPVPAAADSGKVPMAGDNGTVAWTSVPHILCSLSTAASLATMMYISPVITAANQNVGTTYYTSVSTIISTDEEDAASVINAYNVISQYNGTVWLKLDNTYCLVNYAYNAQGGGNYVIGVSWETDAGKVTVHVGANTDGETYAVFAAVCASAVLT